MPRSEIFVSEADYQLAKGFLGKLQGYLPQRWPAWFAPTSIVFKSHAVGPFDRSYPVTEGGDMVVVPTPGHTPNHVSVVVKAEGLSYFLAGDTSYTQDLLLARHPDGVSPDAKVAIRTMDTILQYAQSEPTVYLPSHDPRSAARFRGGQQLTPPAG